MYSKKLYYIILLASSSFLYAQFKITYVSPIEAEKKFPYKDELISCSSWKDSIGINYLVISETNIIVPSIEAQKKDPKNIEAGYPSKEVYAYHFIQTKDTVKLLWKIVDVVTNCPFDLTAEFLTQIPYITDLDKNGIAETWLVYWRGCRSDVSQLDLKIIMHQGEKKYAIRGERRNPFVDKRIMKKDDSFQTLSESINEFAMILWQRYEFEMP